MITETEAAAYVMKQFKGRIMLICAAFLGAGIVLGAILF